MNEIEKIKKELQSLNERLTKLEQAEQNGNQWVPKVGGRYWCIVTTRVTTESWLDDKCDRFRISIGNVFRTKEEAEFEVEKLKVIAELKKYSREFVVNDYNYEFYFNYEEQKIIYDWNRVYKNTSLFFPSEETARQAVQAVGEDRVKKYYLGV